MHFRFRVGAEDQVASAFICDECPANSAGKVDNGFFASKDMNQYTTKEREERTVRRIVWVCFLGVIALTWYFGAGFFGVMTIPAAIAAAVFVFFTILIRVRIKSGRGLYLTPGGSEHAIEEAAFIVGSFVLLLICVIWGFVRLVL